MATSNYDKWIAQQTRPGVIVTNAEPYVAPARGAPKKWRNHAGRIVEVLRAEDEGLDGDGMPWLAVCTEHGNLLSVPTKAAGIDACRDTTQFCDECRAIERERAGTL
jgi:hypothetical protein